MVRRALVFAALVAVGLLTAVSTAAAGPPPGVHDALRLETLSGPAQYVSGGAARVRADSWDGILDDGPLGPCASRFEIHGTSRTVAGAPFDEEHYKCKLQPVDAAIARGLYGSWRPSESEAARLEQIFPTGVCDFTKRDQGRPPGFR